MKLLAGMVVSWHDQRLLGWMACDCSAGFAEVSGNREVQLRFGQLRQVPLVVKPALLHICISVGTNTADLFVMSMSQSSSSKHPSPCFPGHTGTPPIDTIEVIDTFAFEFSSHTDADARRGMGDVRKIWHDTSCLSANMWHTFTDKMTWAPETICKMNVVDYDYFKFFCCTLWCSKQIQECYGWIE